MGRDHQAFVALWSNRQEAGLQFVREAQQRHGVDMQLLSLTVVKQ